MMRFFVKKSKSNENEEPNEETPLSPKVPSIIIPGKCPFVIGAGLGRCGTSSLQKGLNDLGYKTFHMREILMKKTNNPELWFEWAKAKRNKANNAHELAMAVIKQMVDDGYNATTDFPTCLLYEELMEAFPDAKVILSVRSSGEAWADSVLSTIGAIGPLMTDRAPFKYNEFWDTFYTTTYPYLWEEIGVAPLGEVDCSKPLDRDALIKAHDDWTERVKANVPAEKLLVHASKDGYGPICEHLNIPSGEAPDEYPHLNDTKQYQMFLRFLKFQIGFYWLKIWLIVIVILVVTVYIYFHFGQS